MSATPRDLLRRLFDYIAEQLKDIDPRGFQLSKAGQFKRLPADLSGLPGLEFDLSVEGDHVWLRVARLAEIPPPKPQPDTASLIVISSNPDGPPPSLSDVGLQRLIHPLVEGKPSEEWKEIVAPVRAKAEEAVKAYTSHWQAWAATEKPRRRAVALYGELFALKHQMDAEETAKPIELVWGVGIASWQLNHEGTPCAFQYPLLTQAVEVSLDESSMALELRPRAMPPRLELDALIACGVTGAVEVEQAARTYLTDHNDRPINPFDASSYAPVLKLVASNLDSLGTYREILAERLPLPEASKSLVVTDGWVLLSRPRSTTYLVEDLKRLDQKLAEGCDIAVGPLALVSAPEDTPVDFEPVNFRGISSRGTPEKGKPQELFFPLPYNDEQVTIVSRLERAAGVTVQGPPGTGKTHTIANIICHYLATGRRVLVTSKGEPALAVLQAKIPDEIRPLTVALLTNDREGVRQFQASIEAIQHQVSQLSTEQTKSAIALQEQAIERVHAELTRIDCRIDAIAKAQLSEVLVDGVEMRAQKLAQLVVSGQSQFGWFEDQLSLAPGHEPPLSADEAGTLRELRRKVGKDLSYARVAIPSPDILPGPADISALHEVLCGIRALNEEEDAGRLLALRAQTPEVLLAAKELLDLIERTLVPVQDLEATGQTWPSALRAKCRQPAFSSEREALQSLFEGVDRLIEERVAFLKRPVDFPNEGLADLKTKEAIARGAQSGKPLGMFAFGAGTVKVHLAAIKVAGLPPSSADDWAHIQRYLVLHDHITSFVARWNQVAEYLGIPQLEAGHAELPRIEQSAKIARAAYFLASEVDTHLPAKAEKVFAKVPVAALLGGAAELGDIKNHLIRHLHRAELASAAVRLSTIQEHLAGKAGQVTEDLRHLVSHELGNPAITASRVAAGYAEISGELRRINGLKQDLATILELCTRIEAAGASLFAARLSTVAAGPSGDDPAFPTSWREAWQWSRVRGFLDSIEARDELISLSARRQDLEVGLARLYKEVVAKSAWLETKHNATPKVLQALAGYATAIRRIGKGTGANAVRYRRDAREAMLDAAGAVPCWIMSHAKISESMPADIGVFDLVIVDEASQSDLWALPAIVRGKKILVVGDDKQVSPDVGFKSSQGIEELKQRFLADQPYGVEMTPEKSLYDLAARVFAAEQVMLREHFRCVPPIIEYSNQTFYKGQVQPLRIPRASERLDPPLVDLFVEEGVRNRRDCNTAEAEAIAAEISAILDDPKFANRTIGVVSLLGQEQAKHVDAIVRARCSATELLHRKFECGDARTFQGSERDIMFLSLVVDPKSCTALSGNMYEQRFNVAASRARDRMYLVRSVAQADLSEKDLRVSLLRYFDKPLVADAAEVGRLIDLCESGFEREVFTKLVEKGYRVIPQVKSGAYRIDMVVEGANDTRLAIECDGDEFHGPDRWAQDMTRQRVLERAGWTFWRCFASTWSLRKDEVFEELLERLAAMDIQPLGALEHVPCLVEKRTWRAPRDEGEDAEDSIIEEAVAKGVSSPA